MKLTVNGTSHEVDVDPQMPLLWVLRDELNITGPKYGCGIAQCGACTVHIDGKAIKSCTILTVQVDGCDVKTIEGISSNGTLHPLQEAFNECHGLQCGFCTPGMIMTAADLLSHNASPTEHEIRHALEGNFCRCTGYHNIVKAVQHASGQLQES